MHKLSLTVLLLVALLLIESNNYSFSCVFDDDCQSGEVCNVEGECVPIEDEVNITDTYLEPPVIPPSPSPSLSDPVPPTTSASPIPSASPSSPLSTSASPVPPSTNSTSSTNTSNTPSNSSNPGQSIIWTDISCTTHEECSNLNQSGNCLVGRCHTGIGKCVQITACNPGQTCINGTCTCFTGPNEYPCICYTSASCEQISAAAKAHLDNCPGGNPLSRYKEIIGVDPPPLEYVCREGLNECGRTHCGLAGFGRYLKLLLCSKTTAGCGDLCQVAKHEFHHWLLCFRPELPGRTGKCTHVLNEIKSYHNEWRYCLTIPAIPPFTPNCDGTVTGLTNVCNEYKQLGCVFNEFVCQFCGPAPGIGAFTSTECPFLPGGGVAF